MEMTEALLELERLTEGRFLALGEELALFHRQSRQVAAQAENAAAVLLAEKASQGAQRLQSLLLQMRRHQQEVDEERGGSILTVGDLHGRLLRLYEPMNAFRAIVKSMLSLGIAARIDFAGQAGEGRDSLSLADELKRLAELIGSRSLRILERLQTLERNCLDTRGQLAEAVAGQTERGAAALDQARNAAVGLTGRTAAATARAEEISRRAAGFTQDIGSVVSAIQFQDIVRQKLGLARLDLAGLEQTAEPGEVAREYARQAERLQEAEEEFAAAVGRIIASLESLAEHIASLAAETGEVAGAADRSGTSLFGEMEAVIARGAELLRSSGETQQEVLQAIAAVTCEVQQMVPVMEEIESLGAQMQVLALNAGIQAVHSGQRGAALGVIAEEIQRLAREALKQSRLLAAGFREMIDIADDLRSGAGTGRGESVVRLLEEADALLVHLRQNQSRVVGELQELDAAARHLAGDVRRAAGSITVQEEFSTRLAGLLELLRAETAAIDSGSPPPFPGWSGRRMDGPGRSSGEREKAGRPPALRGGGERTTAPSPQVGNLLGDNIELF